MLKWSGSGHTVEQFGWRPSQVWSLGVKTRKRTGLGRRKNPCLEESHYAISDQPATTGGLEEGVVSSKVVIDVQKIRCKAQVDKDNSWEKKICWQSMIFKCKKNLRIAMGFTNELLLKQWLQWHAFNREYLCVLWKHLRTSNNFVVKFCRSLS